MKRLSDKRFLLIALPLTAVLFFGAATFLFHLKDLRMRCARSAFETGDYERAAELLQSDRSDDGSELLQRSQLELATEAVAAGDDAAAEAILAELAETEETRTLRRELDYREAERLMEAGRYAEAADAMRALDGYKDSFRYYEEARFTMAEALAQSGETVEAIEAFLALGSEAGRERAETLAIEYTGIDDAERALRTARGLDDETVRKQERLSSMQHAAQLSPLATGFAHTLGLAADGTALAVGDNTYGQCDVSDWSDLIAVAAGAYHSVGLRADGTMVAAGDDRYGQCRVTDWRDVVAVAAGYYDTIALTGDGRILFTGFHDYSAVQDWPRDLKTIAAGGYSVCAVRRNGMLLAVSPSAKAPEWEGLTAAAVHIGYSLGLKADGTLLSHGVALPAWENIVAVSAGATRILALDAEGTVMEYAFRENDRILPNEPVTGILAIANGATHAALLRPDGTVICFGCNENGECRTESWILKND